jgi:hypothetical protein
LHYRTTVKNTLNTSNQRFENIFLAIIVGGSKMLKGSDIGQGSAFWEVLRRCIS